MRLLAAISLVLGRVVIIAGVDVLLSSVLLGFRSVVVRHGGTERVAAITVLAVLVAALPSWL